MYTSYVYNEVCTILSISDTGDHQEYSPHGYTAYRNSRSRYRFNHFRGVAAEL